MPKLLTTLLGALTLTVFASVSHAQNWGIRFDQMPVGTVYQTKSQAGEGSVFKFIGKKGKYYMVEETYLETMRKYRLSYDKRGHFVSVRGANSYKVRRTPHSCYQVVGQCSHVVQGHTKWTGKYIYNIKSVGGNKYSGDWRRVNTEETRNFKYTLGKYNIVTYHEYMYQGEKKFTKMVRLEEPAS